MSTPKILLVDDVNMFLELEKSFLKISPVRVFTANDGLQALEVIKKEHPDLVFMDLNMPNMNGAECCAAVKADSLLKNTTIIIVTTAGKAEDREICTKAGCDDFLNKPVERKSFLDMARKYLELVDRREQRVTCHTEVTIKADGITMTGESLNISERGIYLAVDYAPMLGNVLDLKFTLPDDQQCVIETRGRVAWLNTKNERNRPAIPEGVGVEMIGLKAEALQAIQHYVDSRRPKG